MYVRIVLGNLKRGSWEEYQRHFEERVIPSSEGTKGLRGRLLLRNTEDSDQGISLSLWESSEALRDYERSDTRKQLAQAVEQVYQPLAYPSGDYNVRHFERIAVTRFEEEEIEPQGAPPKYFRMVWGKLRPGSWDEYENHFHARLASSGREVKGLLARQLLRGTEDPDEGISVSIWDSLNNMSDYETSEFHESVVKEMVPFYREEFWVKRLEVVAVIPLEREFWLAGV